MKLSKITAVLVCVAVFLSFSGCNKRKVESTDSDVNSVQEVSYKNYITLLYSASDTFNPYTAKTAANRQLCSLLYESLVKLDNDFNAVLSIADSVKTEGNNCTVNLKKVTFSDGSSVTASDVVYSYNVAVASSTAYASKLYEVVSVSATSSSSVVFKLSKSDPYFINLLNFPIIKAQSDKITDSDGILQPPIGCGRYILSKDMLTIIRNDKFFEPSGDIQEIRLIDAPDTESISHYIEIGAVDMFYSDISDGKILRMSGEKESVNLNNLIYIGFNHKYANLSESLLRHAISTGIDREAICNTAYYNNAVPAKGFFNPVWGPAKSVQNIETKANKQITIENLENIGYNSVDNDGCRKNIHGTPLKYNLLVNSENSYKLSAARLIADQLAGYGIKINIVEKPYAKYLESLSSGDFQLYLAEVNINANMDISNLVVEGGSVAFSISNTNTVQDTAVVQDESLPVPEASKTLSDVINGFYSGINTITDVASVLQNEMPIIPVCYRTGVLFYNDNIENVNNFSASDIYFSIASYKFKK